jgi:uncharacterized membrane protein HdeD (DUF308 family)
MVSGAQDSNLRGADAVQGLASKWWLLLGRGVAALGFAVLAFAWPGITLRVLVGLFGAFALLDGVIALGIGSTVALLDRRSWPWFVVGMAGIVAGVSAFLEPDAVALTLVAVIAAWAIVTGVAEIVLAVELRKTIDGEWALGLAGIVSVLFGICLAMLAAQPGVGALTLVWVIASYALVEGTTLVVLAFRLRGLSSHARRGEAAV